MTPAQIWDLPWHEWWLFATAADEWEREQKALAASRK